MDARQLAAMNRQADELLGKIQAIEAGLGRIKLLWDELPAVDELEDLSSVAGNIESSLASIPRHVENLPCADDLEDLLASTTAIASNLEAAAE